MRTGEAMALLAIGGVLQRWVPMRRWSAALGRSAPVPAAWSGRAVQHHRRTVADRVEHETAAAVAHGGRRLPWRPTCLAEAFAAQVLLRQRGRAGVVVVGLRRGDDWEAHAWLVAGSGVLTGGPAARGFTATSVFEVAGRLTATELADRGLVG